MSMVDDPCMRGRATGGKKSRAGSLRIFGAGTISDRGQCHSRFDAGTEARAGSAVHFCRLSGQGRVPQRLSIVEALIEAKLPLMLLHTSLILRNTIPLTSVVVLSSAEDGYVNGTERNNAQELSLQELSLCHCTDSLAGSDGALRGPEPAGATGQPNSAGPRSESLLQSRTIAGRLDWVPVSGARQSKSEREARADRGGHLPARY
jgi:hypothetical protein